MSACPAPINVGLVGFGTVGSAVARRLVEVPDPSLRLRIVCTLDVARARREATWVPPSVTWTDWFDDVLAADVSVVIELIGGVEPASGWMARALESGRSVVTANKQAMAERGPALVALARSRGCALRFEAAVGGVIPVLRGVQEGLAADRLTTIAGVVNGTTNFVLTQMEQSGVSLDEALREARRRGFAEADPSADIDGLDARAKLVILGAIGLGVYLPPATVPAASIRGIEPQDFTNAAAIGRVIRQVAIVGRLAEGGAEMAASVTPALVARETWLARAVGARNVIVARGEGSGETVFAGEGAGGTATSVAVVSDVLAIARDRAIPQPWPESPSRVATAPAWPCYVRCSPSPRSRCLVPPLAGFHCQGLTVRTLLHERCEPERGWAAVIETGEPQRVTETLAAWAVECGPGATTIRVPLMDGVS